MNNCPTCASLQTSIQRAQAEHNPEKERIMRMLLDQHKEKQHRPPQFEAVVIWKDGNTWSVANER